MNAVQNFASHSFANYASKNIRVDSDRNGLFCKIPSQEGKWYTVRCVESKKSVFASHCNCSTFASHQHCGHVELVQAYWNKLYPQVETPKVETPVAPALAKTRKPRNGLVRKVRNGGLVKVEQKVVETPAPVQTPKITDISTKGELNGSRAFSFWR